MSKVVLFYAGMFASVLTVIGFSACTDTESDDPDSQSAREKFLGTWNVEESCVRLDYEVEITADENSSTRVFMNNFAFTGPGYNPAYGFVSADKIEMPQQIIGDNWTVQGTGTYQSDGTIFWSYYIEIGANGSNCEANYK